MRSPQYRAWYSTTVGSRSHCDIEFSAVVKLPVLLSQRSTYETKSARDATQTLCIRLSVDKSTLFF